MKFIVYQINLSDKDYENRDLREMYLDTTMSPTAKAIVKASGLYVKVAEIDADDFEEVFQMPRPKTERILLRNRGISRWRFLEMPSWP